MLYKTLVVLSVIAVFAVMIFADTVGGPTMPFNPSIPSFFNPLAPAQTSSADFRIISKSNLSAGKTPDSVYGNAHGCSLADYFNCVNDPNGQDFNTSIVKNFGNTTRPIPKQVIFNLSISRPYDYITQITAEIYCNTPYPEVPFGIGVGIQDWGEILATSPNDLKCSNPQNSVFPISIVKLNLTYGPIKLSSLNANWFKNSQLYLYLYLDPYIQTGYPFNYTFPNYVANFTYIVFHAVYSDKVPTSCSNDDLFCMMGAVGSLTWNIIIFVGSALAWFVLLMGNVIQIVANYFSVLIWLYNIPNLPLQIQLYVDAIVSCWFIALSVELFKLVKPFG